MTDNIENYEILLFYKYVAIEDPEYFARKHLKFCKEIGVFGRVIVAQEGINGTISGTKEQTASYISALQNDSRFEDMEFKREPSEGHAFSRISVKARDEIVSLRLDDDLNPNEITGNHLSPKEWQEALEDEDVIVLDARNDYEYDIGHFRNAIRPDIKAFRELPEWIKQNLADKKDKKILTYCTGGIRCEKFSGFLVQEGFKDVNQLHGGIIKYGQDPETRGKYFDGKCFVFDDRLTTEINKTDDQKTVGKCYHCGLPAEQFVNCPIDECDKLHISCDTCREQYQGCCSAQCMDGLLTK
ncbi:rhodanese-related sulfurtransferase [Pseudalkalibacillus berkeleyi]|uniref:tRNA uridine(34) hydroxylase n=1 Tax=Pseudalkalibacillus berkeleyi TaxID=1069813 RepID=A0ABS9GX08_9BACL|nr:rhodanese-related sulfurtransferase [Pseudalkalibacillus berkeleyi]MCF6137323.1 rhodanese-related sulfurtransferase [Pseudalkalibacillus berkeleyi]